MSSVRPVGLPCRPRKFRLDEDARFLLELEQGVTHFVVTTDEQAGQGRATVPKSLGDYALAHLE